MRHLILSIGLLLTVDAGAAGYYLCVDGRTGRKVAQDMPCQTGNEIKSYAPVSPAELRVREEMARQSKRDFERQNPGTYAPEEYMTDAEYAEYRTNVRKLEVEREKQEMQQAAETAARKAAQAEQRAIEAENAAKQADARAKAAEDAAARSQAPLILAPRLMPGQPMPLPSMMLPAQPQSDGHRKTHILKPRLPPAPDNPCIENRDGPCRKSGASGPSLRQDR